ncbi:uncharacterized protein LOC112600754 [Melanaphis sacchari]|uniref:uncharacterized protein LOC112600754 n=1 Tax=Melanaphis sacchari TaxID=742174 RepID=UPI000DC142CF|nr:uncharacterized protein LOC112600754 [Melanaphis sacchari]
MKYLYLYLCIFIFIIFKFVFVDGSELKKNKFFPNLPVDEYQVIIKAIIICNLPDDNLINNLYLSKTSSNTTELRGNITLKKPLDDNLKVHMNMAVKDSVGGWKNNAHLIRFQKACSQLKNILGEEWRVYLKSFGINSFDCPIVPGFYVSKGYDLTNAINRSNFPKNFFYGTYKTSFHFTDKFNEKFSCITFVIEVKRLWETE